MTSILVVEDDAVALSVLADVLVEAGYHVTPAPDGETALTYLTQSEAQPFDVVVTDIRMHQVDGIDVLHSARQQSPPPAVILLTGFGSLETAVSAIRHGAHDYLLKPCPPDELLKRVASAVEQRQHELRQVHAVRTIALGLAQLQGHTLPKRPPPDPTDLADHILQIGALVIDSVSHEVWFDGKAIHLTPTEFALLHCLAEGTGRVIGYCDIVRHTHGHTMGESEAQMLLKTHIRNLRRKIDPAYLINVRGIGYRMVTPDELL